MTASWLRAAVREPLVHFLVAGATLFALNGLYGNADGSDRSITIDKEQVGRLAGLWEQQWRRPPTPAELDGLIRDHIKDEVYYREGVRLGLDVEDPVIRRRLRNKMEFLATAEVENAQPSEAELARFYAAHKVRYASDPIYSFDQRYFGEDKGVARVAITKLNGGKAVPVLPIPLPAEMEKAAVRDISREFGDEFAQNLRALPTAGWSGPVRSGYGWHAVRVRSVGIASMPPLATIEQRVSNDWRAETRANREAAAYQALLDGYDIRIAKP